SVQAGVPGGQWREKARGWRAASEDRIMTENNDKKRVLIVEDEEGLIEGLEHNFKFEGYDVLTARNGSEGLKLALKQKPDVVVLDIMLPEKDGFTVLKELRQRHRDMPVLVLT